MSRLNEARCPSSATTIVGKRSGNWRDAIRDCELLATALKWEWFRCPNPEGGSQSTQEHLYNCASHTIQVLYAHMDSDGAGPAKVLVCRYNSTRDKASS